MYYLIQTARRPIYDGLIPSLTLLAGAAAVSVAALAIGWVYFSRHADQYAFES